jgi:hypothetical protein
MTAPITLANVHRATATLPPRILIHGAEGVGKTWLGARFPDPIYLQTEEGTPGGLTLSTFGLLTSYEDVRGAIAALANEPHDYKTLVVDTLDPLEKSMWAEACAANGWASIEAPGYGRGYVVVDRWWLDFLNGIEFLRRERGMIIVLSAHSAPEVINDPRVPAYTSYQLRLHKRARGLIQDAMDVIGFLAAEVVVASEDQGFNKKRHRADGGSARWLHFENRPAFLAKSRFELPPKLLCPKDFDVGKQLLPHLPPFAACEQQTEEPTHG